MHPKLQKLINDEIYSINEYGIQHQSPSAKTPKELIEYLS